MAFTMGFSRCAKIAATPGGSILKKPQKYDYKRSSIVFKKKFFLKKNLEFLLTKSNFYTILLM